MGCIFASLGLLADKSWVFSSRPLCSSCVPGGSCWDIIHKEERMAKVLRE